GGARALLGLAMPALTDVAAALEEVVSDAGRWLDAVAAAPSQAGALAALDRALADRLRAAASADLRAARVARLCAAPSPEPATELADRLGLSRQHLRRLVQHAT